VMATTRRVRPPAVAGSFYPADPRRLRGEVEGLLAGARRPVRDARPPKALVVPHAGYVYSGPIAASGFARLEEQRQVRRVVILGPAHRVALRGLALPDSDAFATPLGELGIDRAAVASLADLPQVRVSAAAHVDEHCLEVELPFLQVLLPEVTVVPLLVGDATPAEVAEVLARVWGDDETVVLVSSDLSHYLPAEHAARADRATADEILALGGPLAPIQACGARPLNGFLRLARELQMRAELLDLRNSADTAGDPERVVGYGAFAFLADARTH
jgi:MEMO1 family protein